MLKKDSIIEVDDLTVSFATETGRSRVVENVTFDIGRGETLGLVGESGCGKSVTAMSIMRLLPSPPSRVDSGSIVFDDMDIFSLDKATMRSIRGNRIGMIFQEPMTSLNPCFSIGFQIGEVLRLHNGLSRVEAKNRSVELLEMVGVGAASTKISQYPYQLSGGLRQRVMIAMALACDPKLLIADEPTTALDVTIQAQILDLIKKLQDELEMSILMITHDLGVVARFCDHVNVMYAGRIVESAPVKELFGNPAHPYTRGLLSSIPKIGRKSARLPTIPGMVPHPDQRPDGCYFVDRCNRETDLCRTKIPGFNSNDSRRGVACWNSYAPPTA